tara:strand:+ start:55 stop:507 length:453 start_codon:yes stop_codon:yes gene_type:complete
LDNDIIYVADTSSGSNYTHFFGAGSGYNNGRVWAGNVTASSFTNTSDDRIKHEETPITDALPVVRQLQPLRYIKTQTIDAPPATGQIELGLIAQAVAQIAPLAHTVTAPSNTDEPYCLDYQGVAMYALAAVKELDTMVTQLQARVAALET